MSSVFCTRIFYERSLVNTARVERYLLGPLAMTDMTGWSLWIFVQFFFTRSGHCTIAVDRKSIQSQQLLVHVAVTWKQHYLPKNLGQDSSLALNHSAFLSHFEYPCVHAHSLTEWFSYWQQTPHRKLNCWQEGNSLPCSVDLIILLKGFPMATGKREPTHRICRTWNGMSQQNRMLLLLLKSKWQWPALH